MLNCLIDQGVLIDSVSLVKTDVLNGLFEPHIFCISLFYLCKLGYNGLRGCVNIKQFVDMPMLNVLLASLVSVSWALTDFVRAK